MYVINRCKIYAVSNSLCVLAHKEAEGSKKAGKKLQDTNTSHNKELDEVRCLSFYGYCRQLSAPWLQMIIANGDLLTVAHRIMKKHLWIFPTITKKTIYLKKNELIEV